MMWCVSTLVNSDMDMWSPPTLYWRYTYPCPKYMVLAHILQWWFVKWRLVCQKHVSRAWTSDHIPQYLLDVISCLCPSYLLLLRKSSNVCVVWYHRNKWWILIDDSTLVNPSFKDIFCSLGLCHGLMQERRNSIANALELRLSCINQSMWD